MKTLTAQVLVIGGGTTGAGVARDAAMRGLSVVLAERGDFATGTTGRFHGLLHSGARYAVKDPPSAREAAAENAVLRRIAAGCIEDTGGVFVCAPADDPAFGDRFLAGCAGAGIPAEEIPVAALLRREPRLNPGISRAFTVPDASIDSWMLIRATIRSASDHGAVCLPYHPATRLLTEGPAVLGAVVTDVRSGEEVRVEAEMVVNATGAWAGAVAGMAGCDVTMLPGRGVMIATNHRLVNTVVNRCRMPSDGDILVPIRTVSVLGTTDTKVDDPDDVEVPRSDVERLLEEGEQLVPGMRELRMLRAWVGVRPLFQDSKAEVTSTREVSRAFTLLDHTVRDGREGFVTITGGKLTTFRQMAEVTTDHVCARLGVTAPCRTADEPLPGSEDRRYYSLGTRLAAAESGLGDDEMVCECELVPRRRVEEAAERATDLDDVRRALRLGMGPCQGGFCMYRAAGILHSMERMDTPAADAALIAFLQERWRGVRPVLFGDQMRQARLDQWIFEGVLDAGHLPE